MLFMGDLAVVPVFVNTGAALLPALIAGLTGFVTILFKPKQLIKTCREKPLRPLGVIGGVIAVWLAMAWMPTGEAGGPGAAPSARLQPIGQAGMMTPDKWVELARDLSTGENTLAPAAATTSSSDDKALYFGGGPTRSGYLGGGSPMKLTKAWSYSPEYAMFWSTPLVRGDRVYGAICTLDPPESYGSVVCVNATTGKVIWEVEMKDATRDFGGFFSSPAITADGKSLVIGQGLHPDYDSELVCIDTATGTVKWLIDCPLHIESSPAIDGDIVVVGAGAVEDPKTHKPKSHKDPKKDKNPGYVFAARISTGKIIWKHPVNDPESSPAIADGVVYIGSGFNGSAVTALRLSETDEQLKAAGVTREIWKTKTPHPATGAITLAGDMVLVGCGNGDYVFQAPDPAGAVMALDSKTGKIRWTQVMPDGVLGPIAVCDKTAIVPVRNGDVAALDLGAKDADSRVLWKTVARKGSRVLAGAGFTGTHAYVITHDGYLVILDAKTGKSLESIYVNDDPGEMGMSIASPMVVGGRVYVGTETGGLRCYVNGN
ncbi:MAG: PQQ-binding-like beta-propeller repeat protein [Phycisphaerales bacterium]|nr:PQQ-binding-like beta-propeller repeat protein [Phycisphaerales bacterium]